MAKLSTVLRNEKRRKLVVKFKAKRAALMAVINDASAADEDRAEARTKLERLFPQIRARAQQAARHRHARRDPRPRQGELVTGGAP